MTRLENIVLNNLLRNSLILLVFLGTGGCDFIQRKSDAYSDENREAVARVDKTFLYKDELAGIIPPGTPTEDSISRVESFINSWIRKQLLIAEATRKIEINELEVERKVLDYKYSLISYQLQTDYIKNHLDTTISKEEIETYYKENIDNFILKQNIVQASFIKAPRTASRINRVKDLITSKREKDKQELKTWCLTYSVAYLLSDSTWMVFDELVKNSPLVEIPNKIQFLKTNPYYETSDSQFLYFLKVDQYRISDNTSPLDFVKNDIRNIILNKRKAELSRQLEDMVYNEALENDMFEVYRK